MENTEKMEEIKVKVSKTLATMLDYLALDAKLKIEDKGSKLAVIIASEDAGRIIGRKGQTLESLQLLLNRRRPPLMVRSQFGIVFIKQFII